MPLTRPRRRCTFSAVTPSELRSSLRRRESRGIGTTLAVLSLIALIAGANAGCSSEPRRPVRITPVEEPTPQVITPVEPSAAEAPAPEEPENPCDLFGGDPRPGAKLTFALPDSVLAVHAPDPRNSSERIVFANVYETLVTLDCRGDLAPALAGSWSALEDGRVWLFSCRPNAYFADGTRCTAFDIEACWSARRARQHDTSPPWAWLDALHATALASSDTVLIVTLEEPRTDIPRMLSLPAFAVTKRDLNTPWPLGTGPFQVSAGAEREPSELVLSPNPHAATAPAAKQITFSINPGRDERDLIASGADGLLLRDRSAIEYALSRGEFARVKLSHDRVYLLLQPPHPALAKVASDAGASSSSETADTNVVAGASPPTQASGEAERRVIAGWDRDELARDVVRADAKAATSLIFESEIEPTCAVPVTRGAWDRSRSPVDRAATRGETLAESTAAGSLAVAVADSVAHLARERIIFPAGDEDARRLAERIAAVAANDSLPPAVVTALAKPEFDAAVEQGTALACVAPFSRRYGVSCFDLGVLVCSSEWLAAAAVGTDDDGALLRATFGADPSTLEGRLMKSGAAVPLVMTRPHLLTKRGIVGVRRGGHGTLRLDNAGWDASETMP